MLSSNGPVFGFMRFFMTYYRLFTASYYFICFSNENVGLLQRKAESSPEVDWSEPLTWVQSRSFLK